MTITEMRMFYLFAVSYSLAMGAAGLSSPLTVDYFGLRSHGLIYGVITLGYGIGSATGPLLAGYIFDITGSYIIAFLIFGTLSITTAITASLLRPTRLEKTGIGRI